MLNETIVNNTLELQQIVNIQFCSLRKHNTFIFTRNQFHLLQSLITRILIPLIILRYSLP